MKGIGYIPAKASNISDTLTKKEENVGIILDGIAGMFQSHDEMAYVKKRKGIVKIALRCGVPLVPVYGFGHTSLVSIYFFSICSIIRLVLIEVIIVTTLITNCSGKLW
jgi:1-acyl-sn-glycerol-3-phosphate acyltransferase